MAICVITLFGKPYFPALRYLLVLTSFISGHFSPLWTAEVRYPILSMFDATSSGELDVRGGFDFLQLTVILNVAQLY
jgi:hypothetical protein